MKFLLPLVLISLSSFESIAWGPTGHRVTGLIAEKHLNAKAKKKLRSILGQQSLAISGTWMDDVRSDSTYDYMNDWHWVTVETGETYDQSKKNKNGDVIMTLELIISELKSGKLDAQKELEAIRILVHLVGDIHQPLHVGCCDDRGGNGVRLKWFGSDANLHGIWDSNMIDGTKLSYTELAESLGTPADATVKSWQSASVRDWATESMSYRKQVYNTGKGTLGYDYAYQNMPLVNERLLKAGVRLAGILNSIYGK